jgi:acyl-CoA synthetase (AMP-forming)/AMP-acid ligase II
MSAWTSGNGIVLKDLVPAPLRRRWVEVGFCPDQDVYSLFLGHVRDRPERAAVIDARETVTYGELDTRVRGIAAALADAGLGDRDIIGIQAPNDWRAVAAELAVNAIGAVALSYPPGRGHRDALNVLGRSRASAAITVDGAGGVPLAQNLAGLCSELAHLRAVFAFGSPPRGCRALDPWLADVRAAQERRSRRFDAEGPARILVSSGSEAQPKMVAYSHNALAGGRGNYVGALASGAGPMRSLILVPLASGFGSLGTVTVARHGGTLVLLGSFDARAAVRAISDHRPTHVFGVPTMLRRMAAVPREQDEDLSSVRVLVSSSAQLPESTVDACAARFGWPMRNVYGSADGVNCHGDARGSRGGDVGRPDPAVAELRIVDATGRPVGPGEQGEILARGPMTPLSYVNSPELDGRYRTAGGWVRSGDLGFIDSRGHLHVVDRIKDIVIRGGTNISPAEIEQQLATHPALAEAACVAVPDPDLGECLCACVVQLPGTARMTLRELNAYLESERGCDRRKLPERLVHLPSLPLGPTGKVCRRTLSAVATTGHQHDLAAATPA